MATSLLGVRRHTGLSLALSARSPWRQK